MNRTEIEEKIKQVNDSMAYLTAELATLKGKLKECEIPNSDGTWLVAIKDGVYMARRDSEVTKKEVISGRRHDYAIQAGDHAYRMNYLCALEQIANHLNEGWSDSGSAKYALSINDHGNYEISTLWHRGYNQPVFKTKELAERAIEELKRRGF